MTQTNSVWYVSYTMAFTAIMAGGGGVSEGCIEVIGGTEGQNCITPQVGNLQNML